MENRPHLSPYLEAPDTEVIVLCGELRFLNSATGTEDVTQGGAVLNDDDFE